MISDELFELDTEGFTEVQPGTFYEEAQPSAYEPSPTGPADDLTAEAFRLEEVSEDSRKSAVITSLDQSMAAAVNSEWQTLVSLGIKQLGTKL